MARARNIKPGFFANEYLVELPFETRLLFIGLWTLADKAGRLEDRPRRIKMMLFPGDDVDIDTMLESLGRMHFICRYRVDGAGYIEITSWEKHQKPHHQEKNSVIPSPEPLRTNNRSGSDKGASEHRSDSEEHQIIREAKSAASPENSELRTNNRSGSDKGANRFGRSRPDSLNTDSLNTDSLIASAEIAVHPRASGSVESSANAPPEDDPPSAPKLEPPALLAGPTEPSLLPRPIKQGAFAMSDDWEPHPASLEAVCLGMRVDQALITPEAVFEFRSWWSDKAYCDSHRGWVTRLVSRVRDNSAKNPGSPAAARTEGFLDKHTDRSWRAGLLDPDEVG